MTRPHRLTKIAGGHVVDPARGVDAVADLWIEGGRIVSDPTAVDPSIRPDRIIDARGWVVMAGGIDAHCHLAGSKVNAGRMLTAHARAADPVPAPFKGGRSGNGGPVPSTYAAGYRYAALGYTTALDAAITPMGARQARFELADTPVVDAGFLTLIGNHHRLLECLGANRRDDARELLLWLLEATGTFGFKMVNPGGVERWKQVVHPGGVLDGDGETSPTPPNGPHPSTPRRFATLDEPVAPFGVTPRTILRETARLIDELNLPHPLHIHGLNLGLPGNAAHLAATMNAFEGARAHLAHVQFLSYEGTVDDPRSIRSGVPALVERFMSQPNLTADVGQVMFGPAVAMTADSPVGEFLANLTGHPWISHDTELETGCGIVPIAYEPRSAIHATQWAIGLEWFLLCPDPWRLALTTDHPNGGSFLAYPRLIALLMNRELRRETLATLPPTLLKRTILPDLDREYTLSEIAILTRAAPARILGLTRKGHLGPGADADLTLYRPDDDKIRMFSHPRMVLKEGEIVLDDGMIRPSTALESILLRAETTAESQPDRRADLARWYARHSSVGLDALTIRHDEAPGPVEGVARVNPWPFPQAETTPATEDRP
ncbi:formylmethanofuran dehydrogenase, subunit A [Isosphaera pallida ATCC 43644]|uniref:Formylmethanofuran dehydrogenase, subunit A n=1 Tax=Isosphaera pallida (strain ATCC 43644 / DSM 9630 / IS1B) TaxID=575540 RepID=E8QZJ0_ISOPI|nr:amidohydrolase family protein [Isosphaera pallida]ADV61117.1 formylmethanofuran dehydrogenase, subunit A [Isosphaera pallida ATCC 43644]